MITLYFQAVARIQYKIGSQKKSRSRGFCETESRRQSLLWRPLNLFKQNQKSLFSWFYFKWTCQGMGVRLNSVYLRFVIPRCSKTATKNTEAYIFFPKS